MNSYNCVVCGRQLNGRRDAKSCSSRCRKRLQRLGEQASSRDHKVSLLSRALEESDGYIAPFSPSGHGQASYQPARAAIVPDENFHKTQGEHLSALDAHTAPSLQESTQSGVTASLTPQHDASTQNQPDLAGAQPTPGPISSDSSLTPPLIQTSPRQLLR